VAQRLRPADTTERVFGDGIDKPVDALVEFLVMLVSPAEILQGLIGPFDHHRMSFRALALPRSICDTARRRRCAIAGLRAR
jgi:hypothetical protein